MYYGRVVVEPHKSQDTYFTISTNLLHNLYLLGKHRMMIQSFEFGAVKQTVKSTCMLGAVCLSTVRARSTVKAFTCKKYSTVNQEISCIVRQQSLKIHNNCAFCDKSTKLDIHVTKGVTKRFGY